MGLGALLWYLICEILVKSFYSDHLLVYSPIYSIKNTRDIQVLRLVHFKGCTLYQSYVK